MFATLIQILKLNWNLNGILNSELPQSYPEGIVSKSILNILFTSEQDL